MRPQSITPPLRVRRILRSISSTRERSSAAGQSQVRSRVIGSPSARKPESVSGWALVVPGRVHLRVDRLTSIDASFLAQEREGSHMHIGGVLIFEGPAPSRDELAEHIESRLHLVPRYRQKLSVPALRDGPSAVGRRPELQHRLPRAPHRAARARLGRAAAAAGRRGSSPSASTGRSRCGSCGWWRASRATIRDRQQDAPRAGGRRVGGRPDHGPVRPLRTAPRCPPPERAWSPAPEPSGAQVVAKGVVDLAGAPVGLARARWTRRDRPEPDRRPRARGGRRARRDRVGRAQQRAADSAQRARSARTAG